MIVVGGCGAGYQSGRAQIARDAVFPRESIETANDICDHVSDEQLRKALEWKPMDAATQAFLHGSDATLHLANVAVGGDNVECHRENVIVNTVKFMIGVHVVYVVAADVVKIDDDVEFAKDGFFVAVRNKSHRTVTDTVQNTVGKQQTLYVKEIRANGHMTVVFEDRWWDWYSLKSGHACRRRRLGHLSFNRGHVRAIYDQCTLCIAGRDGTVMNKIAL